jgi:hypothetical protein
MTSNNLPPIPQDEIKENPRWREWFRNLGNYIQAAQGGNIVWTILQGGTGASTSAGARANLGLGSMAVQNTSSYSTTGTDTTYAYRANNLSDLSSASTARTNLGLGTMATQNTGATGTFKSGDLPTAKTITVTNGIITSIV